MNDLAPGPARFDSSLSAWVLSAYEDVTAALRDPRVSAFGSAHDDGAAHAAVRQALRQGLSSERLGILRDESSARARALVDALPAGEPIDLMRAFAAPWSMELAVAATGAPTDNLARLGGLSRDVFLAAAQATDADSPRAGQAAVELAMQLQSAPPALGASGDVQTFVALAQTLPCLLGRAWQELFARAEDAGRLRASRELMPRAVDELLRLSGPSRAVFRRATSEVAIGAATIGAGDRVVLMLSAANRDPSQFTQPNRIDWARSGKSHLAFGLGPHSCVGANLVRMALEVATDALLDGTSQIELVGEPEWLGGFAIDGPTVLTARIDASSPPRSHRDDR